MRVSQPGPVGQLGRLSETAIAFARSCSCGIETAIAFAGVKWAFLVQFSGAVVMSVSTVPCWWRAVVLLVSTSPCCRALCAEFLGCLGACCYKRRQSEGFFAENGGFLAQIDDVCNRGPREAM